MAVTISGTSGITTPGVSSSGDITLAGSGVELLNNSGRIVVGQSGSVLQVVQTAKTDTFSVAASGTTTWADVTGLSVSITPTSTSSKILVIATFIGATTPSSGGGARLVRDSTAICVATSTSNRTAGTVQDTYSARGDSYNAFAANFLDSPATTSAVTYKVQVAAPSGNTTYINRGFTDTDSNGYTRGTSQITVMEIAQ